MAGDWIKMRSNLWDDPRVARIVDITDSSEAAVVGALYWLWATADQHTEDGVMDGLTLKAIDRKTGIKGFAEALCSINWISDHPEGVRIVDFEKHNGTSAKKRCQTAKRVANHTAANAGINCNGGATNAPSVSNALAREREEKREESTPLVLSLSADDPACSDESKSKATQALSCPATEIVSLYHAAMPNNPRCKVLNDARKRAIRQRWKEAATLPDKPFGYSTRADGMAAWKAFFEVCAESPFLTGRAPARPGVPPFVADIDFLMTPAGFAKCFENKYHREAA